MKLWKAILCVLIVSLLVSMALPMVSAPRPPGKPPKEEPPADPAIAYYFQTSGPNPNRLMVMNADGSNKAVVYEAYFDCHAISWSPDGNSLAWSGRAYVPNVPSDDYGVWRLDIDVVDGEPQGSNLQRLVTTTHFLVGAAWSPLGDEIAYGVWTIPRTQDEIQVVPATGGPPESVYVSPSYFMPSTPTWSSDGTRIAFKTEQFKIMVIERATKVVTHTFVMTDEVEWVDWAGQSSNILVFHTSPSWIYTLDIDSGAVTTVVRGVCPSWSPDNSKIVYQQPGRKNYISTYEFSTGDITPLSKSGTRPDWRRF